MTWRHRKALTVMMTLRHNAYMSKTNEYAGLVDERFRRMTSSQKWRVLRRFIWHRDGKRCGLCAKVIRRLKDMHMDHIIQNHHGGPTIVSNLRATHASCNRHRPRGRYRVIDWENHPDKIAIRERRNAR
jgi:5-methylcytosine-specific restriction endonuclease McrA